jgi:type I restriction enzyme R subunit
VRGHPAESWQPEQDAWRGLPKVLAERVRKCLNERGTLDVLRNGVELLGPQAAAGAGAVQAGAGHEPGLAGPLRSQPPARGAAGALFAAQRERIDLVLFLNGLPVATAELKSDFTQSVHDAVDQYRFDRHPSPRAGAAEPLLASRAARWCTSR